MLETASMIDSVAFSTPGKESNIDELVMCEIKTQIEKEAPLFLEKNIIEDENVPKYFKVVIPYLFEKNGAPLEEHFFPAWNISNLFYQQTKSKNNWLIPEKFYSVWGIVNEGISDSAKKDICIDYAGQMLFFNSVFPDKNRVTSLQINLAAKIFYDLGSKGYKGYKRIAANYIYYSECMSNLGKDIHHSIVDSFMKAKSDEEFKFENKKKTNIFSKNTNSFINFSILITI